MLKIFLIICILSVFGWAETKPRLTITTGFPSPESDLIETVLKEVEKRSEIIIDFDSLPNKRSLVNANLGITDGEAARIKGIDKYYPNLFIVPSQSHAIELIAISNQVLPLSSPKDLHNYNVGVIHGMKIAVVMAEKNKPISLIKATDFTTLIRMLVANRLDIIIMNKTGVLFNQDKFKGHNLYLYEKPLMIRPLYMQLHKKNKAYIPRLQSALDTMHKDGTYQNIQNNFFKAYKKELSKTLHLIH